MNELERFRLELGLVKTCFSAQAYRSYQRAVGLNALQILKKRTLAPADKAMRGTVTAHVAGKDIHVPLDDIGAALAGLDETPTFGGMREMYASNVYLRGFRNDLRADEVLDLGSNRGLFLMLAAKVLHAKTAIGIEPQSFYESAFRHLAAANSDTGCRFVRINAFAAAAPGANFVTIADVLGEHSIDRIGFCKCDIEGGEFDIFIKTPKVAGFIDNIAMELHPAEGDVRSLANALQDQGFVVRIANQFDQATEPERGHYLYASRTGGLIARK